MKEGLVFVVTIVFSIGIISSVDTFVGISFDDVNWLVFYIHLFTYMTVGAFLFNLLEELYTHLVGRSRLVKGLILMAATTLSSGALLRIDTFIGITFEEVRLFAFWIHSFTYMTAGAVLFYLLGELCSPDTG